MIPNLLNRLEIELGRGLQADAAGLGLNEATARVLLALEEERGIAMREVARRIGRDPSTTTRFVDHGTRAGLLARRPGATDRRQRMVVLTDAGTTSRRRLVEVRQRRTAGVVASMLAATGLGEGQVEWFLDALARATARAPE